MQKKLTINSIFPYEFIPQLTSYNAFDATIFFRKC